MESDKKYLFFNDSNVLHENPIISGSSDYYPYTDSYSNNRMCFSVAKKAVDYYMREIAKQNKFKKAKIPYIAFYGGEPLINFYDRTRYVNKLGDYCKMGSCVPGDKIYVLPDGKYSIQYYVEVVDYE